MFASGASGIFQAPALTSNETRPDCSQMYVAREDLIIFYRRHSISKTEADVDDILSSRTYANQHIRMCTDLQRKYGAAPKLTQGPHITVGMGSSASWTSVAANDPSDSAQSSGTSEGGNGTDDVVGSTTVQKKEDGLVGSPTSKGYEYVHSRTEVQQGLLALGLTESMYHQTSFGSNSPITPTTPPKEPAQSATVSPAGKDFVQVSIETEVWGCPNCGCKRFLSFDEEHAQRRICAECEHHKT